MSYAGVLGLGAAVRQALDLGLDLIGGRTTALGASLRDQLEAIGGVTTRDLGANRCVIVTLGVDGMLTEDVAATLRKKRST